MPCQDIQLDELEPWSSCLDGLPDIGVSQKEDGLPISSFIDGETEAERNKSKLPGITQKAAEPGFRRQ